MRFISLFLFSVFTAMLSASAAQESSVKVELKTSGQPGAVVVATKFTSERGHVRYLEGTLTNTSNETVSLQRITLTLPWLSTTDHDLLIASGGTTMVWPAKVFAPGRGGDDGKSSGTYLQARHDGRYSLAAFTTWNTFWTELDYVDGNLVVTANGEGRHLKAGESVKLETIRFSEGDDWQQQLYDYADDIAHTLKIKLKPRETFTGWSTWDYFGRVWTAKDVLKNLAAVKTIEPSSNIVQIDGGWWPSRGDFTLVRDNLKPAGGMKGLATEIKKAGLTAGIHFDGGRGDSGSAVYREHPDYFLHDDQGTLLGQSYRQAKEMLRNIYFDYSNPAAYDYLREVTRTMRKEWGYDYIKIDFLWYNLDWAMRKAAKMDDARQIVPYDRGTTSVERLHLGMKAFREGMGEDAWFLGCGAPFGQVYGYIDSLRTAFDIWPNTKQFKSNVMANGAMFYLHERVVYNDADYQISRSREDQDAALVPDPTKDAKNLTRNEVEMWANYVGLFSITKINSDNLPILREERREIFRQAAKLPNCSRFVPIDFWQHARTTDDAYNVMLGEAKDGIYLAIFNWGASTQHYQLNGLEELEPVPVVGQAINQSENGKFTVTLEGMHSAVYKLPAGAKFDTLRRALTVQ